MTKSERRHFTPEFRREAVLLTQTSGRTVDQVADDLGLGRSTREAMAQEDPGGGASGGSAF